MPRTSLSWPSFNKALRKSNKIVEPGRSKAEQDNAAALAAVFYLFLSSGQKIVYALSSDG